MKKAFAGIITILVILSSMLASSSAIAQGSTPDKIVEVSIQSSSITWTPIITAIKGMTLTISGPNSYYFQKGYSTSASISSGNLANGAYTYEIVLTPNTASEAGADEALRGLNTQPQHVMKQSGAFTVLGGSFVTAAQEPVQTSTKNNTAQTGVKPFDVVNADDFIVQGSLCVGFDCVNNESFGFDTVRLKENNTRIGFDDTSVGAFPANDWTIVANDSASGGANYLGFEDVTGAKFPFKVTAGAPTDSLFVSSTGNLGIGTNVPVLDVHINTGDTPAIRLEQNAGSGFTAQTWDVAGNEANFFVRDLTGGSRLPFRIRPGAPTSAIDIAATGNIGVGTASPLYDMDVFNTGANASIAARRSDGATMTIEAGAAVGRIATKNNFPLWFDVNNVNKMILSSSGLTVSGPITATAFNPSSDRNIKENFAPIDQKTVLQRLSTIPISTWNFIDNDAKRKHMGPMAQDFYAAFGLGMDDKHISTVDADGVAFAAIQELNKNNQALTVENTALRSKVDDLAARVSALESGSTASGQASQNWMMILLAGMNLALIALLVWAIKRGAFSGVKSAKP